MSIDYRPSPDHTQPNHPPLPGQASDYQDDEGNLYTGVITFVGEPIANGNIAVAFLLIKPTASQLVADKTKLGNPVALELNGWQYNPKLGRVFYCPCVPPDPNATCP
jgi:hypothetical protein